MAGLFEDWNDYERGSDSWCQAQVDLLSELVLDTIDVEGIREVLIEMSSKNLHKVASHASIIVEHLYKIKYTANKDSGRINHWLREIKNHRFKLYKLIGLGENKDLLTTYREKLKDYIYKYSIKLYMEDACLYDDLKAGIEQLPKKLEFEPEWLINLSIEDLLSKLP